MLRRPATTLTVTAEDIAAFEDRRARERVTVEHNARVARAQHAHALARARAQQQQQRRGNSRAGDDSMLAGEEPDGDEERDLEMTEEQILQMHQQQQIQAQAQAHNTRSTRTREARIGVSRQ
ncbi:Anaphase-promoting complex APC subunit 1 [Ceratocystis lukuohia]|uniref:Anaphase-promoting complex APC subunit 1 n=3 Tax=Ceratocystis TaxID=5157 RepID=A0A0F8BS27_CERFI|nr:Anaphase-promoting complex APC subunit 1 [Ceratocystis platani]PHH56008.1 hypothetical protein CFIMG_008134RA00001 [Ceratocystis fimbriata CBS 114723]